MGEKAPCDDSEASSMQRAAVLEKYGLLRSFCALHAVLLGACAGALVMAVISPLQRVSTWQTSYTPDAVVAEPACPHADLHDWHGGDAQHGLCSVHATAWRRSCCTRHDIQPFEPYKPSISIWPCHRVDLYDARSAGSVGSQSCWSTSTETLSNAL